MPARSARALTAVSSCSGNLRLTDLSLRFSSKRTTWPPERSYSLKSAYATNASACGSVLRPGIAFFMIFYLLLAHVSGADRADFLAVTVRAQSEDDECVPPRLRSTFRSKPTFEGQCGKREPSTPNEANLKKLAGRFR